MPCEQVVAMNTRSFFTTQRGTSMIEVLITILILTFGLLGLAGLQARLQSSEMESYQRSQALILLNDMASRISGNRNSAASYVTGVANPLGTGTAACTVNTANTRQVQDLCEWNNALLGAAEKNSGNNSVGAMIGARGCVEDLGNNKYMVTVAWQGLGPTSAPPTQVACGLNAYDGAIGATCGDLCRRTLTTTVRIAVL